jgi:hypothetical protein
VGRRSTKGQIQIIDNSKFTIKLRTQLIGKWREQKGRLPIIK